MRFVNVTLDDPTILEKLIGHVRPLGYVEHLLPQCEVLCSRVARVVDHAGGDQRSSEHHRRMGEGIGENEELTNLDIRLGISDAANVSPDLVDEGDVRACQTNVRMALDEVHLSGYPMGVRDRGSRASDQEVGRGCEHQQQLDYLEKKD